MPKAIKPPRALLGASRIGARHLHAHADFWCELQEAGDASTHADDEERIQMLTHVAEWLEGTRRRVPAAAARAFAAEALRERAGTLRLLTADPGDPAPPVLEPAEEAQLIEALADWLEAGAP